MSSTNSISMAECIFCDVISGKLPSYKLYEDEDFIAILDIFPKSEGHTLVIPKKHYTWVWDYPELGKYFEVVGKIAKHLRPLAPDNIVRCIIWGWDVPHAHIHLIPGKENNLNGEKLNNERMKKLQKKFLMS